jgi:hypothetical protein
MLRVVVARVCVAVKAEGDSVVEGVGSTLRLRDDVMDFDFNALVMVANAAVTGRGN